MCFVVTVIAVLLIGEICFAFDDGDFQYWSTAKFSFDIDKDWTFTFGEEFRLGDDAGEVYYLWQSSESGGDWKALNVLGTQLKFYF